MATIYISDFSLELIIGTNACERKKEQPVILDLQIDYDAEKAAQTDELTSAVDYAVLMQCVKERVAHKNFFLLEKLGAEILEAICCHPLVKKAVVVMHKPYALPDAKVSLRMEKTK